MEYENGEIVERLIIGWRWCSLCDEGSKVILVCKICNEYLCDYCVKVY